MTIFEKKLMSYTKSVSNAQKTIDREMTILLNANKTFLSELNTEQLAQGIDENGNQIGARLPYRSREYANYKNRLNPVAGIGNPDLRLTGDYWDSITANIGKNTIQMVALDHKADDLARYRGIGIAPYNYPEIAALIRNKIKLNL